jgi:TolB-like protein
MPCSKTLLAFSGGLAMRFRTLVTQLVLTTLLLLLAGRTAEAADLREGVEQLATAIAKGTPENRQVRVAVTDFPDLQGVTSDLGRYISERLTTRLAQSSRFRVIERRRLGQVLVELKFGMSDLVDREKAKQLGRIAGVEGLVVGSISDLGNTVEIDTRLIEIDTGNMLVATTTTISKDDTVRGMYERGREMPAASSQVSVTSGPGIAVKHQEFQRFRVEVEDLRAGPDQITVFLRYVNKTEEPVTLAFDAGDRDGMEKTYLLDSEGTLYKFVRSSGMAGGWYVNHWAQPIFLTIPPKGHASATITFKGRGDTSRTKLSFDLVSAQVLVKFIKEGDRSEPRVAGGIGVSVRNIGTR